MIDAEAKSCVDVSSGGGSTEEVDLTSRGRGPEASLIDSLHQLTIADFDNDVDAWHEHQEEARRNELVISQQKLAWA